MVPVHHPLAAVRDSFNAVLIEGEAVGELMLYGRGAGGGPSASAVLGDLIDAVPNLVAGGNGAPGSGPRHPPPPPPLLPPNPLLPFTRHTHPAPDASPHPRPNP